MASILKSVVLYLMSEDCFDNYFVDNEFFDIPCLKALLSKGLGIGIIAGSVLVKVPQVLKIIHSKSAEGINLCSVLLDLAAITFNLSYNFMNGYPFSAWGDNTFLAFQTAAIAALVIFFGGAKCQTLLFCLSYLGVLYVLNSGLTSMKIITITQSFTIPILFIAKLSQALTNFKNGSTGQLSAATCILLFAGSLARIFTSIEETGDRIMVLTFCASSFGNGVILAQIFYYWHNAPTTDMKQTSKKIKRKKND